MIYRKANLNDIFPIRNVLWKTWEATYSSFIPEVDRRKYFDEYYNQEALQKMCMDSLIENIVVEESDTIVAYLRLAINSEQERFYISSFYVLPEFQGKSIGNELLSLAVQKAKEKSFSAVWVGVMKENIRSVEWYKNRKFQFVEELPFTMGKTTVSHLIGCKKIHE